jgi:hypothetical protein
MRRYAAPDDDNGRWEGFPFRAGDIVVSTRSKRGTTWMQMICALLVFGTPELPRPLADISPWLDHLVEPREAVVARLEAQEHRRILKTHTPLDGLPLDPRATYIVVARHPLDMAVSLYYQRSNLDRHRLSELTGQPVRADLAEPPPLTVWLSEWVRSRATPVENLDSPAGVLHHVRDAWRRRGEPNVVLVHFDDLLADLPGQMRGVAERLGIEVPAKVWPDLVQAATFPSMRQRARQLAPNRMGELKDPSSFFRSGTSGTARELLSAADLDTYRRRTSTMASPDLLAWLHRDDLHRGDPPRDQLAGLRADADGTRAQPG